MKSVIVPILLCLLGVLQVACAQVLASYKLHKECDLWAHDHNECISNPRFMWTACLGSCLQHARNTHQMCDQWAREGECTNNPTFIHINCPRSCGMAIVWSPWVRNKFDMDQLSVDPAQGRESIPFPADIFQASEMLRERLMKYFEGLYTVIPGLSSSAPTEYLGMYGLTEAMLYVFRIHEVIFRHAGSAEQIDFHYKKMNHILDVVRQGYSSDRLMLQLPVWMGVLNESALIAASLLQEMHQASASGVAEVTVSVDSALSFAHLADYYSTRPHTAEVVPGATVTLNNTVSMPLLGLGTWQLNGEACYNAVLSALRAGYRMIDSAEAYGNEAEVGQALRAAIDEGVLRREDVFLATKASDEAHMGYEGVKELVRQQLERLQVTYIDLYFLHSPLGDKKKQQDTWRALEELVKEGTIRALGVSNFDSAELLDLLADPLLTVRPVVLQNKYDIYHLGKQLDKAGDRVLATAKAQGLVLMAYSPFSAFPFVMQPLADPIVAAVAARKSELWGRPVTPAQVLLKWTMQHGGAAIPRSVDPTRQAENLQALEMPLLAEEDMAMLDIIQLLVSSPVSVPVLHDQEEEEAKAKVSDDVFEL